MWINPSHPDPPRHAEPPQESGRRLAVFPRGPGAQLRVNLDTFEGHPFISLRLWERGADGRYWPCRGKGVSVRMHEAAGLAEALAGVGETNRNNVTDCSAPTDRPGNVDDININPAPRRSPREQSRSRTPWSADRLPGPDGRGFDECSG